MIFILKSIKCSIVAVLMLAFSFTACVESEWSPYKSKAVLYSSLLTAQATTISGSTVGDPSLLWVVQILEGSDFCSAVTPTGKVGQSFSLRFTTNGSCFLVLQYAYLSFSILFRNSSLIWRIVFIKWV